MPAFRSIFTINVGMFDSAIENGGAEAQTALRYATERKAAAVFERAA